MKSRVTLAALLLVASQGLRAEETRTVASASSPSPAVVNPTSPAPVTATYSEVPYYLNKLQEAQLEGDKVQLNKVIHDAIVEADLSDKKVVKQMDPIIEKVRAAITAGLDRAYVEGQSSWLASAVAFYDHEKLHPIVDVPESDWAQPQTAAANGLRISTFPDRILLHEGEKTRTATESSNIHEAVISSDGRRIAYFRTSDDETKAEIWVVDTRKLKRRKVASAKSCLTLLFSADSGKIFFQEVPESANVESGLYSVGTGGGKPRELARVRLLQTTIEKGLYKGDLVVYKALLHPMGTAVRDCAAVITPSGKEIGRIKDGPCR